MFDEDRAIPVTLITLVLLLFLICITGFFSFYTVGEQENAIVTQFGKIVRTDTAGLYFKIPFLQRVHIVDMSTKGMTIGYNANNESIENESTMITSDFNFVNVDFYLEYKISDPINYLYTSSNPEEIMRNMVLSSIRNTVINYTVDDVITTGKSQIQTEVKEKLTAMLNNSNLGLQIVNITIQDSEPPTKEVVDSFKAVETAKQGKETEINKAKTYESEALPKAISDSDKIIQNAEAVKAARIAEANGQVARFNKMFEQYTLQPMITKQRLFFETMEDILPNVKVIITDNGKTAQLLPLNSFSSNE